MPRTPEQLGKLERQKLIREKGTVTAKAKDDGVELILYGSIGEWFGDITARRVKDLLNDHKGKAITVRINSLGGEVFEATAIYNLLRAHGGHVTTIVDGIAASAGVHLMLAGDTIKIAANAQVMIHNPWGCQCGEARDMRKYADMLDKTRGTLVTTYLNRVNLEEDALVEMLDAETFLTADEALEYGFVDEVVNGNRKTDAKAAWPDAETVKNSFSRMVAQLRLPDPIETDDEVPELEPEPSTQEIAAMAISAKVKAAMFARDLTDAVDASDEICKAVLKGYFKGAIPEEDAKILDALNGTGSLEQSQVTTPTEPEIPANSAEMERSRIKEIQSLCGRANCADMAAKFIDEGTAISDVQAVISERLIAKNQAIPEDDEDNSGGKNKGPDAKYEDAYEAYQQEGGKLAKDSFIQSMKIDSGEISLMPTAS